MKYITCLCLAFLSHLSWAQEQTLQGRIVDEQTNQPVVGAIVSVSGSSSFTITNTNGEFELSVSDTYQEITVSIKGYKTRKFYLGGSQKIELTLQSNAEESTSIGFGKQSRTEITSSVSSIKQDDVSVSPLINLEQTNQGKTTGLFVQNSSGKLGEGTTVRIRGGSSLSASNQPLYVIDGVPLTSGNQSNINPSNIETIEILKDASAGAMYGSRAANGVILITTKSGSDGKMKIDADYQFGISETPNKLNLYSPQEYRQQFIEYSLRFLSLDQYITKSNLEAWEASGSSTITVGNDPVQLPSAYDSMTYNTNWQDKVFRTAASHRSNVSLQGGSDEFTYFASAAYTSQEGILIGNKYDRLNGSLTLNSKLTSKLTAKMNLNYFYSKDFKLLEDEDVGAPLQAIVLPPADSYDPQNNYSLIVRKLEYNPLTEVNYSDNLGYNNSLVGNMALTYDFSNELSLEVNGGLDYNDYRSEIRQGPETRDGALTGRSQRGTQEVKNYIFNGWFNYRPEMTANHKIIAMLGASYQQSNTTASYRVANINSIDLLKGLSENDPSLSITDIPGSASVYISSFGRFNYSFKEKYLAQVSARMDGSSKFGPDNRYGFFPAISGGWIISNESFMQNESPISFLKLKGSYGLVGNTPQDDFLYRQNYYRINYGDQQGVRLGNLANPGLKWETTAQLDIGIDVGFFNDRVSASVDYYNKTTTDLLFSVPVSQTSGFSSVLKNVGTMENKGFEFNLSTINFQNNNFSWTTDFNISFNQNTVTDLDGANLIVGVNAFLENESAGVFYMRKYMGVDPTTEQALYDNGAGGTTTNWENAPRQVVGDPNPDYYGGFTNSFRYKNFELSALFQFVGGADLYFETGEFLANSGILNLSQTTSQTDRWYNVGDDAKYPALDPFQENTSPSTRWLEDGSYLRLKTITLSYNLPEAMVARWKMNYVNIYIGATNLLTITNYIGYDPDVSYFDPLDGVIGQNISRGIDNFTAPQPRVLMTGIKICL